MGHMQTIYRKAPVWAQHALVSAYGLYWHKLRFGSGYKEYLQEYSEREQFTSGQWRFWQQEHLKYILQMAANSVPFYQQQWNKSIKDAAKSGRLCELPLLEKDSVRANPSAFIRQDKKSWPHLVFHTSGSTGTPIASIWTVNELRNSLALRQSRSAKWAGVSYQLPRATFSGRLVEPNPKSKGPFYRFNAVERQVYFSAFHLRPENAHAYVIALQRHRVQWLTGYAVSYYLLARFILEQSLEVPPLKAIITTSEKVSPGMRRIMEEAYGCKVYEEYSTVENAIFASECESGRLHVSPDVAVVEILRPDGMPCEPGEVGEVVTTCLMRTYQPFIRYKIGDLAAWDPEPCPCGRKMPVLKEIIGRVEDVVIGPDGRRMVRFHGIFVDQPNIREGQIIQENLNNIRVKVVPTNGFNNKDVQEIIQRIHQRLSNQVEVNVEIVDAIPRTGAGKFQAVISHLHNNGIPEAERIGDTVIDRQNQANDPNLISNFNYHGIRNSHKTGNITANSK